MGVFERPRMIRSIIGQVFPQQLLKTGFSFTRYYQSSHRNLLTDDGIQM